MSYSSPTEMVAAELSKAEARLAALNEEIGKATQLVSAWKTILEAQKETPDFVIRLAEQATISNRSNAEEKLEETKAYGDKANILRTMLINAEPFGLSRIQIVEACKELSAHANYPYRFIDRMSESGEMSKDENGRYHATPRMRDKMRDLAA
jgi:hypothetical protein